VKKWVVIIAAVGGVVLLGLSVWFGGPVLVRWAVRDRIHKWESRHHRHIRVGRIVVHWGRVVLRDVTLSGEKDVPDCPLVRADEIIVSMSPVHRRIHSARVRGLQACLVRYQDGSDNVSDLLRRASGPSTQRARFPVLVTRGAVRIVDHRARLSFEADRMEGSYRPGKGLDVTFHDARGRRHGLSALFGELRIWATRATGVERIQMERSRVALLPRLVLTDVAGWVRFDAHGAAKVDLSGSYGGAKHRLWRASGQVAGRGRTARLDFVVQRFSLDWLDDLLARYPWGRSLVDRDRSFASGLLHVEKSGYRWTFSGSGSLSGLNIANRRLSHETVRNFGFAVEFRGWYDALRDQMHVPLLKLSRGAVALSVSWDVTRVTGRPRIRASAALSRTRCSRFLHALPRELAPKVQGFEVGGSISGRVSLDVDFGYLCPSSVTLDADIDYRTCSVLRAPFDQSAERLRRSFIHQATDGRIVTKFVVGPSNPDFVPLEAISRHVVNSILTTEDSRFFSHHGFIYREFRTAFARNLIARRFRYGASSITMQMVKNVLLNREKTLARKLQELLMTAYIERHLTKQRIMEIYLNVIEFGPGIYGIGRAARHYFGKPAALIEPQEAAFLSTILPSPKKRSRFYCMGRVTPKWRRWIDRILVLMFRRHRLTKEELDQALATPIVFSREEFVSVAHCRARIRRYLRGGRHSGR